MPGGGLAGGSWSSPGLSGSGLGLRQSAESRLGAGLRWAVRLVCDG